MMRCGVIAPAYNSHMLRKVRIGTFSPCAMTSCGVSLRRTRVGKRSPPSVELRYQGSRPSTVKRERSPVARTATCGKMPLATALGLLSNETGPAGAADRTNTKTNAAARAADVLNPFIVFLQMRQQSDAARFRHAANQEPKWSEGITKGTEVR